MVASLIGFVLLIVGASSVASELKSSLNQIWDLDPDAAGTGVKAIVTQRSKALVVVLGCGFLLLVSLAVSSVLAAAGSFVGHMLPLPEAVLHLVNALVGILVITGVFAVMFKYLPDVDIQWRDVFLGALFTSSYSQSASLPSVSISGRRASARPMAQRARWSSCWFGCTTLADPLLRR